MAGLNFSCQEDETLNLVKYPENPIQINCEGNSDVKVTGTYDENGKLIFSTPLQKNMEDFFSYSFSRRGFYESCSCAGKYSTR